MKSALFPFVSSDRLARSIRSRYSDKLLTLYSIIALKEKCVGQSGVKSFQCWFAVRVCFKGQRPGSNLLYTCKPFEILWAITSGCEQRNCGPFLTRPSAA